MHFKIFRQFFSLLVDTICYFLEIPKEIDDAERNIYIEAMKLGTEKSRYVRIQVIGKHRVGKTSIVRRLLNKSHDGTSTDGLEINKNCQIRIRDGEWIVGEGELSIVVPIYIS